MAEDRHKKRESTTDENCTGWCSCPVCGGPAHWSFVSKMHACSDRECATEFREHEEAEHAGRSPMVDDSPASLREQAVEFTRQLRAHCDDVSVQHIRDEMPQVGCGRCVNLVEAFGAAQRQAGRAEALREAEAVPELFSALKDAVQVARNYHALFHDEMWKERLTKWEAALRAAGQEPAPSPVQHHATCDPGFGPANYRCHPDCKVRAAGQE